MTYLKPLLILILASCWLPVCWAKTSNCYATIDLRGDHSLTTPSEPLPYVNTEAPQGGTLRLAINNQFNSLNPFILKGIADNSIFNIYEPLMKMREDIYKLHGHLATCLTIDPESPSITFQLNPDAKWHDGHPITAEDVVFTFQFLKTKGHPIYNTLYQIIQDVSAQGTNKVVFHLSRPATTEDLFTIARGTILPAHFWKDKNLEKDSQTIPLGSGPYRLKKYQEGRFLVYEKVDDYWGSHLPQSQGRYNFKMINYDFISDRNIARQAVFSNEIDLFFENVSKAWATQYSAQKNLENGTNTLCLKSSYPTGMQAFQFNLRNPLFQDKDLRRLIADAFDFHFSNSKLFYNQYARSDTFFGNTSLSGQIDFTAQEKNVLQQFSHIPPSALAKYTPPFFKKHASLVKALQSDLEILLNKGYTLQDGQLYTPERQPVSFKILQYSPAFERVFLAFAQNLKLAGVHINIEKVIPSQYTRRLRQHQFDMIVNFFSNDGWPVEEVRLYWHSSEALKTNSQNKSGLQDQFVDELLDKIADHPNTTELSTYLKLLDHYLLNEYIVIPHWYLKYQRIAAQQNVHFPATAPRLGLDVDSLWMGEALAQPFMKNCATL